MVGAVMVKNGHVIGEGIHQQYGEPHAEVNCLKDARDRGHSPHNATMYVTLEPCAHEGKTPACAPQLVDAKLGRVVVALEDPMWRSHAEKNDLSADAVRGLHILQTAGVETEVGLCYEEAAMQNAAFLKRTATSRPLVLTKWAMTADGKIATRTGASQWISGQESRRRVHELRGRMDAVIVGAGTALHDDPELTCRTVPPRREAARVVVCGSTCPPLDSRLVRTLDDFPVILAYSDGDIPRGLHEATDRGCRALSVPACEDGSGVDCSKLLHALGQMGMSNVLVEGGSKLLGSFFDAEIVDRAWIFLAPRIIGGRNGLTPVGGQGVKTVDQGQRMMGTVRLEEAGRLFSEPEIELCICEEDILIKGWLADPREYYGEEMERKHNE